MNIKKYKVGIIGCGRMGSTIDDEVQDYPAVQLPYSHAAAYSEVPQCEIVAAADIDHETLSRFGSRWGVDKLYTNYLDMLQNEQLDIVSITTRATERAQIIHEAIDHGVRGIFAEKALATTLAEADAIIESVEETDTVLAVHCTRRWNAYYMKARSLIEEGVIGKLQHINAALRGGMSHSGSHAIDMMRMLAGSGVSWVMGHTDPAAAHLDDDLSGNGYLVFENGVTGFYNSMSTSQVEFEAIGTMGRIRTIANGMYWELDIFSDPRKTPVRHIFPQPNPGVSPTVRAIQNIIQCLEDGSPLRCTARDGREALEVAIAIRESERRGGVRISLPLQDRSLTLTSR